MVKTKDTVLVLRYSRMGRIPPAQFSTELICESGLPVLVVEYGNLKETTKIQNEGMIKFRIDAPLLKWISKPLQFPLILAWVFIKLVLAFCSNGRPKILVAHGLSEQVLAWVLSTLFFVPYVIHAHEVYDADDLKGPVNRFLLKMEKRAFKKAAFIIFPEATRAQIYQERYSFHCPIFISANTCRNQEKVIPIDLRKAYHLPADSIVMGYLGGVGPSNVLELAIQALAFSPKVYCLVWGWGERAYIEKLSSLAHVLGVAERFIYLGSLLERKFENLAGCDFSYCVYEPNLLRLKHAATASNKLFEAMAVGIPSVMSSNPDFFAFNKKNAVGICARSLTVEGISSAIQTLADHPGLRKNLGENARAVFEKEFHYEHQFFKPIQAYQDLYCGYPEIWSLNHVYLPPALDPKPL
jgi:glycosyltransferase involved in cell wall biosynthesis